MRATQQLLAFAVEQIVKVAAGTPIALSIEFHLKCSISKISSFAPHGGGKHGGGGGEGRGALERAADTPRGRPDRGGSPASLSRASG
jgi:hypothetical protein